MGGVDHSEDGFMVDGLNLFVPCLSPVLLILVTDKSTS